MTGPGAGDTLRPVRTLRSLAFLAVGLFATTVGTGVLTSPAHGDDTLELKVRSGAVFAGRLTSADAAWLRLKSADGSEVRLAWKDLDERSWLTAKKATTPATDAKGLLELGKFAAEKGWRTDAESILDRVRKLDGTLAAEVEALAPRLDELRRADAKALFEKGQAEVAAQRYLHALGRFREARELSPKDARIVTAYGEAQFYLRKLKECRATMDAALALDPNNKDALLDVAQLDLLELDFEASLKGFERVVALPVEPGKYATREEVLAKGKEAKLATADEAFAKFADAPLIQAREYLPFMRGVVAGPKFAQEFRAQTEHYDVKSDVSQELADLVAQRLELIYAEYDRRFGYSKTGEVKTRGKGIRFPVLVFKDKKGYVDWFGRVLQNPQFGAMTGGVYVSAVKHLVFYRYDKFDDTQLVAWHEGFHQYLDYFVSGASHWFNEGSADYFGGSVLPAGKKRVSVGETNPWRGGHVGALLNARRLPEAKWFMQTSAQTFMRLQPDKEGGRNGTTTVGDHYAAAWALVHFLLEGEGGRWQAKYVDYFKAMCDGMPHEEAFEKVWGKVNWEKFQAAWVVHCTWLANRAFAESKGAPVPPMPK